MNILEAELIAEQLRPIGSYLAHTIRDRGEEGVQNLSDYIDLAERIAEAKLTTDITGYEDAIDAMQVSKDFFSVEVLPMLYKDHIENDDIKRCKRAVREIDMTIEEAQATIYKIKERTKVEEF